MEYVAWYFIITGVTALSAAALFCWYGYLVLDLYDNPVDEEQAYINQLKLEHEERKRLEEYWIWRRVDDND